MTTNESRPERRREPRICPKGTVLVRADTYLIRGRIANLSRSGLLAITPITTPERLLGARVEVSFRLDGAGASWLELRGRLMRIGAGSLALALDIVPLSFTRILDQTLSRSPRHDRSLSMILVDATFARRTEMAEAFRAAGCDVLDVSTPLEAVVRLGESEFEPDLIAIADSLPASISDELRRFVDVEHPHVLLVRIGDAVSTPEGLAHWLSAANAGNDLSQRVRDVLTGFARPLATSRCCPSDVINGGGADQESLSSAETNRTVLLSPNSARTDGLHPDPSESPGTQVVESAARARQHCVPGDFDPPYLHQIG
jgi:hypothetical protein